MVPVAQFRAKKVRQKQIFTRRLYRKQDRNRVIQLEICVTRLEVPWLGEDEWRRLQGTERSGEEKSLKEVSQGYRRAEAHLRPPPSMIVELEIEPQPQLDMPFAIAAGGRWQLYRPRDWRTISIR